MKVQYVNLTPSIPKSMDAKPYNVESLRVVGKKQRVLVVLDHVPTEDLKTRKLMSGATGATIDNCCHYIDNVYQTKTVSLNEMDILFTPFNLWKTYHLAPDKQAEAEEFFANHIRDLIEEYKPDYTMICGPRPFNILCPQETELAKNKLLGFVGSSFPKRFGQHQTRIVYNLSPNSLMGKNISVGAYLLGYFSRAWLPIFGTEFRIPAVRTGSKRNFKIVNVDNIKKFDAMLRDLRKRKRVSVDTETNGLRRIMVNMLTLQLCGDGKTAYLVAFDHVDAKWSPKEHQYVKEKLREFFEYDNDNDIHVYTNAKFDMSILRTALGVRSFKNDIWDIIAGEFALDENGKNLATITGDWYYKLATISLAYGCRAYLTTAFGKQHRAMIKDVALTDDVIEYCSLDVIIPWHIVDQQMAKAKAHGYDKYCMMVRGHISDQIHSLAVLEHTGAPTDVDYLFKLSLPDSPINSLLSKTRGEFIAMPEVKRTEKVLRKRGNIPSAGLFGDIVGTMFKLSNREHLQTLFFDVMGLSAPESNFNDTPKIRHNGEPEHKIGKSFQNMHKNNPVIKAFTEMSKLFKLRNAYVKSLIRMFGEDEDFRATRRLRPNYNYDKIVTGRTSADAPKLGFSVGNSLSKAA